MSAMCGGGGNAVGPPQLMQAEVWWWVGGSIGDSLSFLQKKSREDVVE